MELTPAETMAGHPRVLAVAGDRGSAQAISPVIAALCSRGVPVRVLAFPEVHDLFVHGQLSVHSISSRATHDVLATVAAHLDRWQPHLLLSGSSPRREGGAVTAEQAAVLEGRSRGIPSLAILDYWGMYGERFGDGGGADLSLVPDWICALDRRCRDDLVRFGIPPERVLVTHNPWLDRVARDAQSATLRPVRAQAPGRQILLVLQPLAPVPVNRSQAFWQDVLRRVVKALASRADEGHRVVLWRHPAQDPFWFQQLANQVEGDSRVSILPTEDRSDNFLAYADAVITVHSTTAYEALHFGTPCVSLRVGIAKLPLTWADELELSIPVRSFDALDSFIRSADLAALRADLLARKPRLLGEGVFFSDGGATGRVVRHALDILGIPPGTRRSDSVSGEWETVRRKS